MNSSAAGRLLALTLGGVCAVAHAEAVSINGFLTTSLVGIDESATYLNAFTDQPRFDNTDSRLGLQFTGAINDRMSATAQLLARGRGSNNTIETDWAFVSMDVAAQAQVRAGKLKFPTFLISDYYEVGYAYPWMRPPQEVYSLNPISTLVGVDALYTPSLGGTSLLIQPFVGSNRGEAYASASQAAMMSAIDPANPTSPGDAIAFDAPVLAGINAVLNFNAGSLRLGYTHAEVDAQTFGIEGKTAGFASAGLTVDWHDLVLYTEYVDRDAESGLMEAAFPDQRAGYVTLGYRLGKFLPHVTYAKLDEGKDPSNLALKQTSSTVGLRYELADGAALKFEYQRIEPDQGNPGLFDRAVEKANLYGLSLDVIF